jgi:xylulokinase
MIPTATGAFVGLTRQHTQAHLTRAVLEGVAFAFRDRLDTPDRWAGSRSVCDRWWRRSRLIWRQIMANALGSLQTLGENIRYRRGTAG